MRISLDELLGVSRALLPSARILRFGDQRAEELPPLGGELLAQAF